MELDKRIIKGKRPLTCFDIDEARKYVGKLCYVSNSYDCFRDLKNLAEEVILIDVEDCETPFHFYIDNQREFCLPAEWVKTEESEKKYRAYTLEEFIGAMNLGELEPWIRMRPVGSNKECKFLYTGYQETEAGEYICLGCFQFDFISLFKNYEIKDFDGKWKPFGVLDEEKE